MNRIFSVMLVCLVLLAMAMAPAAAAPQAPALVIQNISITDVTSAGFTVSWTTDAVSNGAVDYWPTTGGTPPGLTVADAVASTTTHYVPIPGLSLGTSYTFQVRSGGVTSATYQVTTATFENTAPHDNRIVLGQVTTSLGVGLNNAIVYLELSESCALPAASGRVSARTVNDSVNDGTWYFDLSNVLNSTGSGLYPFVDGVTCVHVYVQGGLAGTYDGWKPTTGLTAPYNGASFGVQPLNGNPTAVSLARLSATPVGAALPLSALGVLACGALGIVVVQHKKRTD